ncbi:hypothetical protein EDC04DRAFT_2866325 [Pisolithus marmoratus]|nr:hypothetical protein EDC04DRAFT_2866325 [Pisolithus marmoratus]
MADSVAAKSTFLCMYMKNHPDTLVAYVKHYGKVTGNVTSAEMTTIDTKGMTLRYKLKGGGDGQVVVSFQPPLSGYDEVKPRLLSMKADAQESLGMIKAPHLTTFRLSLSMVYSFFIVLFCCSYATVYPSPGTSFQIPFTTFEIPSSALDVFFTPIRTLVDVTGYRPSVRVVAGTMLALHTLESLYTWSLCKRYVRGWSVKATYIASTFIFGMPVWMDIHRRVQQKRIESVMKAE